MFMTKLQILAFFVSSFNLGVLAICIMVDWGKNPNPSLKSLFSTMRDISESAGRVHIPITKELLVASSLTSPTPKGGMKKTV